jgi:hypothetical protein
MRFTNFGQTGLRVSRMILGTGTFGKQTHEQEAHRMLDAAAEAGINFRHRGVGKRLRSAMSRYRPLRPFL